MTIKTKDIVRKFVLYVTFLWLFIVIATISAIALYCFVVKTKLFLIIFCGFVIVLITGAAALYIIDYYYDHRNEL